MMDLTDKKTIINLLKHYRPWSKKSLGQNFLIDKNVLQTIIKESSLKSNDNILEIGPGLGTLTKELCQRAGDIVVVEKDNKLAEDLKNIIGNFKNLRIINKDILQIKNSELPLSNYKLIANIPYNITAPILKKFLSYENEPKLIILMIQKEVAQRICAKPGELSILALMVQFYSDPKIIRFVSASSFFPKPNVESAIVKIENIQPKYEIDEKSFFRCIKIGFSSPRKTLINNLSAGYRIKKGNIETIIRKIRLKATIRAQELSINQWQKLSELIKN